jgi:hypothetical protein
MAMLNNQRVYIYTLTIHPCRCQDPVDKPSPNLCWITIKQSGIQLWDKKGDISSGINLYPNNNPGLEGDI